jgi:hypothetical protein
MKHPTRNKTWFLAGLMTLALCLANVGPVWAQDPGWPGHVEGTGTYFEVTDSEYLNVTLQSSEPVTMYLDSVPQIVAFDIEAAEGATSAQITLTGLAPDTTYYKYEDDYHNLVEMTTTAEGAYVYTQDLAEPHLVLIQTQPSTYYIDANGGDCGLIGDWDQVNLTCTLTQNIDETIVIYPDDGITLDGNGYTSSLTGQWGVQIGSVQNTTVRNLHIEGAYLGVGNQGAGTTIEHNSFTDCIYGARGIAGFTLRANNFTDVATPFPSRFIRVSVAEGNNFFNTGMPTLPQGSTMSGNYWEVDGIPQDIPQDDNESPGPVPGASPPLPGGNFLPIVDAGGPCSGDADAAIALDGATAYDLNEDPLTYAWSVGDAVACSFDDASMLNPHLTCNAGGEYQVTLTADDGQGGSASDSATATVEAALDTTPPEITPSVSGDLGDNGWYVSDVTVSWTVTDLESEVSETSGCEPTVIDADTAGITLECTATSAGGTASESVTIKRDATAPTASASASPTPNANGWNNSDVTVSFSGADNLSGIDACDPAVVLSSEGAGQSASGTCTDLAGNVSALATASGIDIDKTPPTAVHGGPFEVDGGGSVPLDGSLSTDALSGVASIAWDVDGDGYDDGINPVSLQVIDLAGNVAIADTQVTVVNVAPTIDDLTAPIDPVNINDQPVSVEVAFSDPGAADTHDVTWDWGDDNSDTQVGATSPATQGHAYATPGVYVVTVTVTDDDGGTATGTYEYIVIYDPEGGFVTGGGWIMSPAGAYAADPTLTGKANFGFVSKYKKGASTPTGETEFQFKAGDLNFHSSSYDWLVVAGANAKYKGVGTINGEGNYGFMLTATDGSPDTFRIKIWDKDNGDEVVYDNKMGADDDGHDGTEIGGGNIKVHKAK